MRLSFKDNGNRRPNKSSISPPEMLPELGKAPHTSPSSIVARVDQKELQRSHSQLGSSACPAGERTEHRGCNQGAAGADCRRRHRRSSPSSQRLPSFTAEPATRTGLEATLAWGTGSAKGH